MTKFSKQTINNKDIFYEILGDGYKIYVGQQVRPSIHQYEPYIPDPSKSYEENAIITCEDLATTHTQTDRMEERLTAVESNVDYLMLLNDSLDE